MGQSYERSAGQTKHILSLDEILCHTSLESCEKGDWIYLALFRNKWRGAVNTTVDLCVV